MARNDFPHPLTQDVPAHFCHPSRAGFTAPFHHDGTIYAGNGYIAIRCHRGLWLPTDFPDPTAEVLTRFTALPWDRIAESDGACLKTFHDLRPALFRFREYPMWNGSSPARCPIVLINGSWHARLSHLQLISRLPRAELIGGIDGAIAFRFAGGCGIMPRETALSGKPSAVHNPYDYHFDFEICKPSRPHFDGVHLAREHIASTPAQHAQSRQLIEHWHKTRAEGAWPPYDLAEDLPPPDPEY